MKLSALLFCIITALHAQTTASGGWTFIGPVTAASFKTPTGTVLEHSGVCQAATSVATPPALTYTYFCDSANSDHFSRKDSSGTVVDLEAASAAASFTSLTGVPCDNAPLCGVLDTKADESDLAAKEDSANKSSDTSLGASDTLYPTQHAVKVYVDAHAGSGGVGRSTLSATWTAIPDGGCQEQAATWTGVATSDTVALGIPAALTLQANARVSASNTVAIRLCNFTGASVTPGGQTFNGTLAVYNLSGTGTINFSSLSDGNCGANTFSLTGVSAGDPLTPKWPAALESGLIGSMVATATDTVTVRLCNLSGASLDPASATFGASVAK